MSTKAQQLADLNSRIQQLQRQLQSPVEALRFPNGSSMTFRSRDDILRALQDARRDRDALESGTTTTRTRRIKVRMR